MKLFSILAMSAAVACFAGTANGQQIVAFSSLPQGTTNYFQCSAIAKVIQKYTDLTMRVNPLRSGAANLTAVGTGDAEFALGNIMEAADSIVGKGNFKGNMLPKIRIAFNNRPLKIGLFVRKDSGINSIADLKGKRIPSGWSAYPQGPLYIKALLGSAGLMLDDMQPVPVPDFTRSINDFKEGRVDTTFVAVGAPLVTRTDSAVGGLKFLSLPEGAEKHVKSLRREFFVDTVMPSKRYVGIEGPTRLLSYDIVITTSTNVPDDVVYKVVKTVHEHHDELVKIHPSFRTFDPRNMAKPYETAKYHPGALKYFKEAGLLKAGN